MNAGETESDLRDPKRQLAVLHAMLNWVVGVVDGRGPETVHLVAKRDITAGELVGTDDLRLHAGNQRPETYRQAGHDLISELLTSHIARYE